MSEKQYRLALSRHIGAASVPCIAIGQEVKRGEQIAKIPVGKLGANLHASVSGIISAISEDYIEITAEHEGTDTDSIGFPHQKDDFTYAMPRGFFYKGFPHQWDDFVPITGDTITQLIEAAGIVGMGGAGFPTAVKLSKPLGKNGRVILNAAECEPVLAQNITRIKKEPGRVYQGLLYAMQATGAEFGVIAIKGKHKEAIRAFEGIVDSRVVSIHLLEDIYPSGEERAVIREVCGVLLNTDQLPSAANCAVINAETALRITEAVELRKPVISKDITIAGQLTGGRSRVFLDVPIGTSVGTLIRAAGGMLENHGEIIMGGPFTGESTGLEAPVTKISGGIMVTMPFLHEKRKLGLLVCACGPVETRMREIAAGMKAEVVGIEYCKQAIPLRGGLKCENPGKCPGQAEKVISLKKMGAQALLIGNCTDCTNTVMSVAPKLGLAVHHSTDGLLRAAGTGIIRRHNL
ncbi:proline reductase-associated electron transfer protein PrdC [Clostridia bacterium]|nr:proline reductase-associated electron transfer protein PrdC [Clostridia bacterium]